MNFYAAEYLLFFWTVPAVIGIFLAAARIWKNRLAKIGSLPTLQSKLMLGYQPSEKRVRLFAVVLALILSICALARPQWGEEKRKVERKGVDIIFLFDTSLSMLSDDIKPNRFEKSKIEIKNILKQLKGDRIGMVAFAGSSFLQSPLTLDYSAFLLFLDAIKVGYIPDPGTSLDRAIKLAIHSFPEKDNKHKAVILFTDGEDHEGGIESAIEEAKKSGLRIYTLGAGTAQGAPIPLKDEKGRTTGFKKDRSGQVVVTKLNADLLQKIAHETGGIYLPSTPAEEEIDILLQHLESIGKRQYKEKLLTEREDHFQIFLFLAILCLIWEMLIKRVKKSSAVKTAFLILVFVSSQALKGFAADPVKLYEEKKYQSAADVYQKAKTKNPEDPLVRYNLGTSLYQLEKYQEAAKEFEKTVETAQEDALKAKALYNYGNTQYRLGQFEKAIESYKKALELDPKDKDAKYNLEFLQKQKSMFDKKDSQRQNEKQNQQQQLQNQQQQNQQQQNQQNQQNQQQNQQNQQQNQNNQQQQNQNQQNQQDQQDQEQNQQDQSQGSEQNQDQDQEQGGENQDQQNQPDQQNQDQQETKPQDQKDQADQKSGQGEESEQNQGDQEENEQQKPQPQEQEDSDQQEDQQSQQPSRQPLQGQMSMENAMQILEALKEGEKEMQDLRRPAREGGQPRIPEKDW